MKNSWWIGIALGLIISAATMLLLDAGLYLYKQQTGQKLLQADVVFALSLIVNLLLTRMFIKKEGKEELGKGFLFSLFIWGLPMYICFI